MADEFVRGRAGLGAVSAVGYRSTRDADALHRGLPSPFLTLIFSLDGPVISGETAEHARSADAYRTEIVVGGLHRRPACVVQPPSEAGIQLALHPMAARAVFGVPAGELTAQLVTDGIDVFGRSAGVCTSGCRPRTAGRRGSRCCATGWPRAIPKAGHGRTWWRHGRGRRDIAE